jgi:hypothetical protein
MYIDTPINCFFPNAKSISPMREEEEKKEKMGSVSHTTKILKNLDTSV